MTDSYVPKLNDVVFMEGHGMVKYVVAVLYTKTKTADVRTTSGPIMLTRGVSWSKLHHLDGSQNAARIVREGTENS